MEDYPADWTPLHRAVWRLDSIDEVRSLANGHSVDVQDNQGWTPVHLVCARRGSLLMFSHQISSRKIADNRRPYRSSHDSNERLETFAALRILLQQRPNLEIRAKGFCTPLHCAANSGWYSHASALIRAGAPVYTGPRCSPLCWAAGGNAGNYPVAILLREELGEHGLSMIEADHERDAREAQQQRLEQYRQEMSAIVSDEELELQQALMDSISEPQSTTIPSSRDRALQAGRLPRSIPRPPLHGLPNTHGLCPTCSRISFEGMEKIPGYMHMPSLQDLKKSAEQCKLCNLMLQLLGDDMDEIPVSQIIVGASNGNHSGCNEPYRLRTLDFAISEGCICNPTYESSEPNPYFPKCKGSCKSKKQASVTIFTDEVNDQRVQTGIEITRDPLSSATRSIIHDWYTTCDAKHKNCRRNIASGDNDDAPLPTRVIEVGENKVRLVNCANKRGRYLALSHRWNQGPMPEWVTREANDSFKTRLEWFSIDELPATVKDAVKVTRELGFQYVWIDSICIIQDSPQDWTTEASNMAAVYANAYMTLFADCGKDDNSGFLFPRMNALPSISLPIQTADPNKSLMVHIRQTASNSYGSVQKSLFEENVESAYLSDRAWIFQERILSVRLLHFGRDQIFWECNTATIAEDGHIIDQDECGTRDLRFSKQAFSAVIKGLLPSQANEFERLPCLRRFHSGQPRWQDVVKVYSSLRLTHGEDKLIALSGLASSYAQKPESHNDKYIAGMWQNELIPMLSWKIVAESSQLPPAPSPRRIPSFSWVAVDSPVDFQVDKMYSDFDSIAHVVRCDTEFATADIYGNIRSCSLTLKAPVAQAFTFGPLPTRLGSLAEGSHPLYNEEMLPIGRLDADHHESLSNDQHFVYLQLLKSQKDPKLSIFLVLTSASGVNTDSTVYRRVGIGSTEVSSGASGYIAQCMFTDAPIKTVEII